METVKQHQVFDDKAYQQRLKHSAESYRREGYSVIPVYGYHQPGMAKRSVVLWKPYQQLHPTLKQIRKWFQLKQRVGGLAIITGHLSRLIVLDFDDSDQARDFAERFPELTQTRIVLSASRGLPHYYYRIPPAMIISTQHGNGMDLLGEGSYVVTSPTQLPTGQYTENNQQPLSLTHDQVKDLIEYVQTASSIKTYVEDDAQQAISEDEPARISRLYEHLVTQLGGRNKALYHTARSLSRASISLTEAIQQLAHIHVKHPPITQHSKETNTQRTAEAHRTIRSAYKKAYRSNPRRQHHALPNKIREELVRKQKTAGAQVLEAFYLSGGLSGGYISYTKLLETTNLTNWTIRSGLRQLKQIRVIEPPPKCKLLGGQNQPKRGRPEKLYRVLGLKEMFRVLKLLPSYLADTLTWADVKSAKAYRVAQLREFLKRRPGQYVRDYLARIVGVTTRTTRRYTGLLGFNCMPIYHRSEITCDTADFIEYYVSYVDFCREKPVNNGANGVFLVINGQRYPPRSIIAYEALKRRDCVWLYQQQPNSYSHQEGLPLESTANQIILTFKKFIQQINMLKYGIKC